MYLQVLKNISSSKGLSRSDLARLAGVSRATVTKWFQQGEEKGWVNIETGTLMKFAAGLNLSPAIFLVERTPLSQFKSRFLWDSLYPNMEEFIKALIQKRLPAIARLVQVSGFRPALFVVGKSILSLFDQYKKYIKPARRKQLEILWPLYTSPT